MDSLMHTDCLAANISTTVSCLGFRASVDILQTWPWLQWKYSDVPLKIAKLPYNSCTFCVAIRESICRYNKLSLLLLNFKLKSKYAEVW